MRSLSLSAPVSSPERRHAGRDATASARSAPRSAPSPASGNVRGPAGGTPAGKPARAGSSIDPLRALDEVAQQGRATRHLAAELRRRCAPALAEVTFPAARWQLVIAAELYGADADTRALLARLPVRTYSSLTAVIATLVTEIAPPPVDEHTPTAAL